MPDLWKHRNAGMELEECTALLFPTREESIQLFWFLSEAVNKNNPTFKLQKQGHHAWWTGAYYN